MNLLAQPTRSKGLLSLYQHEVSTEPSVDLSQHTGCTIDPSNLEQLVAWFEKLRSIAARPVQFSLQVERVPTDGPSEEAAAVQDAGAFLQRLKEQVAAGNRTDALDSVFDTIDDLLLAGSIERVRWILRAATQHVDGEELPTSAFLSMLTITRPWRATLDDERTELARRLQIRVDREAGADASERFVVGL